MVDTVGQPRERARILLAGTAFRVRRDQPNARVIFSLRDPTDRVWSAYRFSWRVWYHRHVPEQRYAARMLPARSPTLADMPFAFAARLFSYSNIVEDGMKQFEKCMAIAEDGKEGSSIPMVGEHVLAIASFCSPLESRRPEWNASFVSHSHEMPRRA
eukprot:scaffold4686_cov230-Pinguiococcus_pyrenoidosus.AAC.2